MHSDPSSFPFAGDFMIPGEVNGLGDCECPCGAGHVSNVPFPYSADASASHACGCIMGLSHMLRQPWVCAQHPRGSRKC